MRQVIVVVNGLAESGKDTFVGYAIDHLKFWDKTADQYHRSDPAKTVLSTLGWNGEKDEESRKLLAALVNFGERNHMTLTMVQRMLARKVNRPDVLFVHCREDTTRDEITSWAVGLYHTTSVFITRPDHKSPEPFSNISGWDIDPQSYDRQIQSLTLKNLSGVSKAWCEWLINAAQQAENSCVLLESNRRDK